MGNIKTIAGKFLYGLLFVVILPLLLLLWVKFTGDAVNLPVPGVSYTGFILIITGLLLLISGMLYLWIFGKGLPMNAYPPQEYVKNGIYAFTRHPVYSGAVLLSFGISVITGSASGFWLVSPIFTLMIFAYVVGFENERTTILFGKQEHRTFLSLPERDLYTPSAKERLSGYFIGFLPWVLVYEAFIFTGVPGDSISTNLPFERSIPVWEFSEIIYISAYLFALLIPLVIRTRGELRSFITDIWFATTIAGLFYFAFPFMVKQAEFTAHSFAGRILLFERSMDGVAGALPSFHVIWAFLAAKYFTSGIKRLGWIWYSLAVLISISCITTGNHSVIDVLAGFVFFMIIAYRIEIWDLIRLASERLANSWREWRIGPVRIINHGFYGGAAGFAGTFIAGIFLGAHNTIFGFVVMLFVIAGAGMWAQLIEGSPKLLRPYGYYGGLLGGILACSLISLIFHTDIFLLFGSFALAGPWIQILGRLRCLVQGCCHGRPSGENIGIRFTHPLSRVNKISGLNGVPLHPTQLYSIGCNLIAGIILIRLYRIGMSAAFISGIYLIINGLGRFVEESFRGEAQTPYWNGMRIYQWIAIINIVAGAAITTVRNTPVLTFKPDFGSLFYALIIGIIVTFASGVDFPESNRRFARLTSN